MKLTRRAANKLPRSCGFRRFELGPSFFFLVSMERLRRDRREVCVFLGIANAKKFEVFNFSLKRVPSSPLRRRFGRRPRSAREVLTPERSAERRKICATQKNQNFFAKKFLRRKPFFLTKRKFCRAERAAHGDRNGDEGGGPPLLLTRELKRDLSKRIARRRRFVVITIDRSGR